MKEKFGVKRYHPEHGVRKFLVSDYDELPTENDGWYDSPSKFPKPFHLISEEEWKKCDEMLGKRYGLTKNSFKKDVMKIPNTTAGNKKVEKLFPKVIAEYGDKIEYVKHANYFIYRWKDGDSNDDS